MYRYTKTDIYIYICIRRYTFLFSGSRGWFVLKKKNRHVNRWLKKIIIFFLVIKFDGI